MVHGRAKLAPVLVVVVALLALPATAGAVTFEVNQTDASDDGTCDADCSLVEAINAANIAGGADEITFNIGAGGVQTIAMAGAALPTVTAEVEIDGTTQPGLPANQPRIEIDGQTTPAVTGLTLGSGATNSV